MYYQVYNGMMNAAQNAQAAHCLVLCFCRMINDDLSSQTHRRKARIYKDRQSLFYASKKADVNATAERSSL
jgi:hypothetical protein